MSQVVRNDVRLKQNKAERKNKNQEQVATFLTSEAGQNFKLLKDKSILDNVTF